MPNKTFTCVKCDYSFSKDTVSASGYESGAHGKHMHCQNCGAIMTSTINLALFLSQMSYVSKDNILAAAQLRVIQRLE